MSRKSANVKDIGKDGRDTVSTTVGRGSQKNDGTSIVLQQDVIVPQVKVSEARLSQVVRGEHLAVRDKFLPSCYQCEELIEYYSFSFDTFMKGKVHSLDCC